MQCWFREFVLAREAKSPLSSVVKITMIRRWSSPGARLLLSPEYGDANDQTVELNFPGVGKERCIKRYYLVL